MRVLDWIIQNPIKFTGIALMVLGAVGFVVGAVSLASGASAMVGSAWMFSGLLVYLIGSTINRYLRGDFYYQRL